MTPIAKQKCSKRSFAGQVTSWKKRVYEFVAEMEEEEKRKRERFGSSNMKEGEGRDGGRGGDGEETKMEGTGICIGREKRTEVADEDDGVLSDMEDIELDDFGNVLAQSDVTPASSEQDADESDTRKQDHLQSSIFDEF